MGPTSWVFLLSLVLGILGTDEEKPENLLESICGRPAVLTSIASGREATAGQWPWQVSIRQGLSHVCAATLISEQWVLTAASCFWSKDTRKYHVLMGSLQAFGRPDTKATLIPVSRVVSYPDFQENTSSTIAVAELAYPVSFSPAVLPICLPSSAFQLKNSTSCWVTGWDNHSVRISNNLKMLRVPLSHLQTCRDYYQESLLQPVQPVLSEPTICSKPLASQRDHCIGSKGDPLICKVEDFWVLAGVVSWTSNCLHSSEPAVYTNISLYKSWIEKLAISFTNFSATHHLHFSGLFTAMLLPFILGGCNN
ncbi:putative serine protease 45 [Erinaceus europaeus]|uniref:Serine protease 45 n=1 Tax=Erinaceus europaeus TaxID=9365 RepID=A0ABM3WF27_ERIEU|nr:putative serine protease 45 [Erinaceus europaeus]